MILVAALALVLSLGMLLLCLYRWCFTAAYLFGRSRLEPPQRAAQPVRFAALVPAHDEELLIAATVGSILSARAGRGPLDVFVIADNCSDRTAELAAGAGAHALERSDAANPGKGRAIEWALGQIDLERYDAVVLFDADVLLAPDFFDVMERCFADGQRVLQGYYDIANPDDTALTRLMAVTSVMKNLFYNGGKTVVGLSPLLMGTGMVFPSDLLGRIGWHAHSIAEDYEETLHILELGERVRFVPAARFYAQEATTLQQGFSQRQRWSSGQVGIWHLALDAVGRGFARRQPALVDAGLEILLPSYSMGVNLTLLGLALAFVASAPAARWIACAALALQLGEFALALVVMRARPRFVASIAIAPLFLGWKALIGLIAVFGRKPDRFVRTERKERKER